MQTTPPPGGRPTQDASCGHLLSSCRCIERAPECARHAGAVPCGITSATETARAATDGTVSRPILNLRIPTANPATGFPSRVAWDGGTVRSSRPSGSEPFLLASPDPGTQFSNTHPHPLFFTTGNLVLLVPAPPLGDAEPHARRTHSSAHQISQQGPCLESLSERRQGLALARWEGRGSVVLKHAA